ncbi:MAG: SGNH/GDSL hydrolase family protein [Clostridia bacterium]|nr:SGNH/GDSL hydrolase family protein [Clostridia bacterium]
MKIMEKIARKAEDHFHNEGVTVAFLGDSVTQGCFEIYKKENGQMETVFDKRHSYERYVLDMLSVLFPNVTVNLIHAGISGDRAPLGLARLDRDVLRHEPDLTVVCYGLNDCGSKAESVATYVGALRGIFEKLREAGSEIIFMTPNMMNTGISPHLTDPDFIKVASRCADLQNGGAFDAHIDGARALCRDMNVPLCDCYGLWKRMHKNGVDVTELLANKINHPTREMNMLFAYELVKTMLTED